MPSEVWSWPEATIRLYPSGTASAAMAYAESVDLTQRYEWRELRLFGGTGTGYIVQYPVGFAASVTIGQMWHTQGTYSLFRSATGVWAGVELYCSAGNSAGFLLPSARVEEWSVRGADGGVWRSTVRLAGVAVSAYGTAL